ncbi:restriction endonuclease subunit S [Microbulbifer celer]|uniref:Restriction endonuclease subunit S n=1 Tax=Microbulbifer celer TaxID=435905 RepID=A0ABW3U7K7_9GAMM|nr:restriction endonuclease subunit S [Microbulbifer celer]UFN57109.1 restriction endonuclease subunit S [Microbulbifer celer]
MYDVCLPSTWKIVQLSDIADFIMGQAPKKSECNFEGVGEVFVKAGEFSKIRPVIKEWTTNPLKLASNEDVLICVVGATAGKLNLGINCAIGRSVAAIRPLGNIKNDYIYSFLLTQVDSLRKGSTGSAQGVISRADLSQVQIPVAGLTEQKVIAEKLDTLLAQVENTKARLQRIPQILKRFRQSVLAAGVTGKLSKDWRKDNSENTTEALLKDHLPLPKPARWKSRSTSYIEGVNATAVGKPENSPVKEWQWVPLVEIARMESGHTPSRSKPEYWGGDICWIGIKDANKNHATKISDTEQKTNELGLANSASRLLPEGTVCISRTASVGYVVKMAKPMATSQDFVNWVPSDVVDPDWLMWLFVAERESLFKFGKGSTHTTVYFPEWLSMHVLLPHIKEQRYIARRIEQLFAYADTIEKQVNNAQAAVEHLTQSILTKAFRGELTEQWRKENPELISGENSAEALLERIQAERAAVKPAKKTRRKKS